MNKNTDSHIRKKILPTTKPLQSSSNNIYNEKNVGKRKVSSTQASTLRKIKSLRRDTSVGQKEEVALDGYKNMEVHFRSNTSSFKEPKKSHSIMNSVVVSKRKIGKIGKIGKIRNIESNIRELQNRNTQSIDRQKQLINHIDSYRRHMPFEFNHNYTKEIVKANLGNKMNISDTYSSHKSRITPIFKDRPSTAKLFNLKKKQEEEKTITPLQEFLEMKKALSFQIDSNDESRVRSNSIESKSIEAPIAKKQPQRYKTKTKFAPVPDIQMNSSICMQEIVSRLDDIQKLRGFVDIENKTFKKNFEKKPSYKLLIEDFFSKIIHSEHLRQIKENTNLNLLQKTTRRPHHPLKIPLESHLKSKLTAHNSYLTSHDTKFNSKSPKNHLKITRSLSNQNSTYSVTSASKDPPLQNLQNPKNTCNTPFSPIFESKKGNEKSQMDASLRRFVK